MSSDRMPENRKEMLRAGYKFLNAGKCKRCQAPIEWWQTTHGSKVPFDPPAQTPHVVPELAFAQVHKRDCQPAPAGVQERFANVQRIAEQLGARLVLVLDDGGHTWAAKHGLDPEDVKHELITAANEIRREMSQGGSNANC